MARSGMDAVGMVARVVTSGARLVATASYELVRRGGRYALYITCIASAKASPRSSNVSRETKS